MCSRVVDSLDSLLTTRSKFIDHPLFQSDLNQLLTICEHWTFRCLATEQRALTPSLSNDLRHLWNITDLLFSSSTFGNFWNSEHFSRYRNCRNYLGYRIVSFQHWNVEGSPPRGPRVRLSLALVLCLLLPKASGASPAACTWRVISVWHRPSMLCVPADCSSIKMTPWTSKYTEWTVSTIFSRHALKQVLL